MRRTTVPLAIVLGSVLVNAQRASAGPPGTSGPGGGVGWVQYYCLSSEG